VPKPAKPMQQSEDGGGFADWMHCFAFQPLDAN
jgi:hypothetical protein